MSDGFYVMRPWNDDPVNDRYAYGMRANCDADILGESTLYGVCPVCGEGLGQLPCLPPHRITLSRRSYPDILWPGGGGELMVTEKVLEAYRASGMTGITRVDPPSEIVRVGGRPIASVFPPPPTYHTIWHVYGAASLNDARSGAVRPSTNSCEYCRRSIRAVKRVVLEEGSWNGADIFDAFGLPGDILVSSRFKAVCDAWGITGATFVAPASFHFDLTF